MPTPQDILADARALGKKIAQLDVAKRYTQVAQRLEKDLDAQRLMNDFARHMNALAEKEQQGRPIEVTDKKKAETLQKSLVANLTLRDFQMAQMDFLDLMRSVDEAISEEAEPRGASGPTAQSAPQGPLR